MYYNIYQIVVAILLYISIYVLECALFVKKKVINLLKIKPFVNM